MTCGQGRCPARAERRESVFLASFLWFPGVAAFACIICTIYHATLLKIINHDHPLNIQKKDWGHHLPCWMNALKFLRRGWASVLPLLVLHFWLGSKWWTHVLSWVTARSIKSPGSSSSRDRRYLETSSWVLFLSLVNIGGTHIVKTFDIPKMSVRISCTAPKIMPTSLAMLRRSCLLSHITRVCTTLTFSSVVASLGRPNPPSSSTLSLPL